MGMLFRNWIEPYIATSVGELSDVTIRGDTDRELVIQGFRNRGGSTPQAVTITVDLGKKVATELREDIAKGDKDAQDLLGNHIAKLMAERISQGVDDITIDIR
jgi:hypothetical protein